MSITQQKVLEVLRDRVADLDEKTRFVGYRQELLTTLAEIMVLEREHQQAATQIQKKISDKCGALGRLLTENGWTPS